MMKKIGTFLFLLCLSVAYVNVQAQAPNLSIQNIAEVKVDELSDDQIKQFLAEFKNAGYGINQLEAIALQRKMLPAEIQKLKVRVEKIEQKVAKIGRASCRERVSSPV